MLEVAYQVTPVGLGQILYFLALHLLAVAVAGDIPQHQLQMLALVVPVAAEQVAILVTILAAQAIPLLFLQAKGIMAEMAITMLIILLVVGAVHRQRGLMLLQVLEGTEEMELHQVFLAHQ